MNAIFNKWERNCNMSKDKINEIYGMLTKPGKIRKRKTDTIKKFKAK